MTSHDLKVRSPPHRNLHDEGRRHRPDELQPRLGGGASSAERGHRARPESSASTVSTGWRDHTPPSPNPLQLLDWRAEINRLEAAYSPNTLRAYRSDLERFEAWCLTEDAVLAPASPEAVAAFIAEEARGAASATLRRGLAAIRKLHRLLRLPCPVDDEAVSIALRRALRGKSRRPRQARGVTAEIRDALIAGCPTDLRGLRDRTMIAVGYDTLCRRSELVALRVEDLTEEGRHGCRVLVRRTKVDPFGDGRWAYLSSATVPLVRHWLQKAGLSGGPIFRAVKGAQIGRNELHPIVVGRLLRRAAPRANLASLDRISGHSLRVGAAQDLMAGGRDLLAIMTAGRWSSPTVVGQYVAHADVNIWLT